MFDWLFSWMSLKHKRSLLALFSTARSQDRAVLLWALVVTTSAGLSLVEENLYALFFTLVLLPLNPERISIPTRILLATFSVGVFLLGSTLLLVIVPFALFASSLRGTTALTVLGLTSEILLSHHFQSLPDIIGQSIHLASATQLAIPILTSVIIFSREIGWRSVFVLLGATAVATIALDLAGARWINFNTFTSPGFRLLFVLFPLIAAGRQINKQSDSYFRSKDLISAITGIAFGAAIALLLPTKKIETVVFDESHGHWETVLGSFGPNDFGRGANYTYTALFAYAAKLVGGSVAYERESDELPSTSAAFVLKMPSTPLSESFATRLEGWVKHGGRLLIVADHTDLYDSTQNLNAFLYPRFGIKIGSDAVFDKVGMPTKPVSEKVAAAIGRINANGQTWAWQTGSSLYALPLTAVELADYGSSFSEPGDYSRPNRFGPFLPRTSLRFGNHTSILGLGVGTGAIVLILDSTPWSNFSIFIKQYKLIFSSIIGALEKPAALKVLGYSSIFLLVAFLVCSVFRAPVLLGFGGVVLGLALGTAGQIGSASFIPHVEGRDFQLRVALGESAKLEFLKQLVAPGERNFVRILSALGKYGLEPSSSAPGTEVPNLLAAKKWLLVQPDPSQLPSAESIFDHLTRGGHISILFGPEQAADLKTQAWLATLGLNTQRSIALSVAEDARPGGLLNRRGAAIFREIRTLTAANQTSKLKERDGDQFIQSYTARPTSFPRTSGLFNIGFSADQFSDDAVGEIWDGIYPSSIGRLRERQIGSLLSGMDIQPPMPPGLNRAEREASPNNLENYLLLVDGKTALTGKFTNADKVSSHESIAPIENPVGYLDDLRIRSNSFIAKSCPRSAKITQCESRLLGADMLEWMVSWASNDDGEIVAVELLHERKFSGVGSTLNVVFSR